MKEAGVYRVSAIRRKSQTKTLRFVRKSSHANRCAHAGSAHVRIVTDGPPARGKIKSYLATTQRDRILRELHDEQRTWAAVRRRKRRRRMTLDFPKTSPFRCRRQCQYRSPSRPVLNRVPDNDRSSVCHSREQMQHRAQASLLRMPLCLSHGPPLCKPCEGG